MYVITSKYTHKMWLLQHVFNASFDSLHIIALTKLVISGKKLVISLVSRNHQFS